MKAVLGNTNKFLTLVCRRQIQMSTRAHWALRSSALSTRWCQLAGICTCSCSLTATSKTTLTRMTWPASSRQNKRYTFCLEFNIWVPLIFHSSNSEVSLIHLFYLYWGDKISNVTWSFLRTCRTILALEPSWYLEFSCEINKNINIYEKGFLWSYQNFDVISDH